MKLLAVLCFATYQVTVMRTQECSSFVEEACPGATAIEEVPAWLDPSDSPVPTRSGVHATNCDKNMTFTSKTNVNCLDVLALSSNNISMILDTSSFNATANRKVQSLSWRLAKLASIFIGKGAFEGVEINLYIYDVKNFSVAQGAFVNCRGSISMHNVNASVHKNAAIDSSILFIRHGELHKTNLSIIDSNKNYTNQLKERVFAFTWFNGGACGRSSTSTNEIVLATFSVEIAVLVTCCATLITTVILFVSMQKLYRQNYEAIARENKTQEVRSRANDVPNLPLPPRPPPEVVTPNKRPKAKNCV